VTAREARILLLVARGSQNIYFALKRAGARVGMVAQQYSTSLACKRPWVQSPKPKKKAKKKK
jgi:hypothetical protein